MHQYFCPATGSVWNEIDVRLHTLRVVVFPMISLARLGDGPRWLGAIAKTREQKFCTKSYFYLFAGTDYLTFSCVRYLQQLGMVLHFVQLQRRKL